MAGELSTLVLKVDLHCPKCYNKIRQVLCKFDCQIQSKIFDEENNTVTITGFFHPCKFAKKLCCKAGKVIKSIEIIQSRVPEKHDPQPCSPVLIPIPEPAPPAPRKPDPAPRKPVPAPVEPEPAPKEPVPQPKIIGPVYPDYPRPPPFEGCCRQWYEGYGGRQCHCGYVLPEAPSPCYDYYGSRAVPCSCGCGGYRRCVSSCDDNYSEENPDTCNIM